MSRTTSAIGSHAPPDARRKASAEGANVTRIRSRMGDNVRMETGANPVPSADDSESDAISLRLDDPRICGAKNRDGSVCTQFKVTDASRCRMHGGSTPRSKAAAKKRKLEARIRGEAIAQGWTPVTDPVAEYADNAGEILAFRDVAREQVNALTEWAHSSIVTDVESARAVIAVYSDALDKAEKTLGKMIQFNLDATAIAAAMRARAERPTMDQAAWAIDFARQVLKAAGVDQATGDAALTKVTREAVQG